MTAKRSFVAGLILILPLVTAAGALEDIIPRPVRVEPKSGFANSLEVKVVRDLVPYAPSSVRDEAYMLDVEADGVTITASDPRGERYARTTLRQLLALSGGKPPCCRIVDWPRLRWRGYLNDCGRNYLDMAGVKAILDVMSLYKLNLFHWHLTDYHGWRLESKRHPGLQSKAAFYGRQIGRYYTQDDFREIVSYAAARGITVMPELDVPGHSLALRCGLGVKTMSDPGVEEMVSELFRELCSLAPADVMPFVHLGTDEARTHEEKCPDSYLTTWAKAVNDCGRKAVIWAPGKNSPVGCDVMDSSWYDNAVTNSSNPFLYADYTRLYNGSWTPFDVLSHAVFVDAQHWKGEQARQLGAVGCTWQDDNVGEDTHWLFRECAVFPSLLGFAETFWSGRLADRPEFLDRLPAPSDPYFQNAVDFERRLAAQRDTVLRDFPFAFPFVRQTDMRWRLSDEKSGHVIATDIAQGSVWIRNRRRKENSFVQEGTNTVVLETWIRSPNDRTIGAWIDCAGYFGCYSRLGGRTCARGEWNPAGAKVLLNGRELPPPEWKQPAMESTTPAEREQDIPYSTDLLEKPLVDELPMLRPPTRIRLQKGWNHVRIILPHYRNWGATFCPIAGTSEHPREIDDLEFSSGPRVTVVQDCPGYNSWPMVQSLANRLICAYSRGSAHTIDEPARGVFVRVSDDGGKTWSEEAVVVDDPTVGEVAEGIGRIDTATALLWVRCWGQSRHHDVYRTTDGLKFERMARVVTEPFPMQVMDPVVVPGLGIVSPWFAGDYRNEYGGHSWGLLISADGGRTWDRRIVESDLAKTDWPTEPCLVCLGDGRLLIVARSEDKRHGRQFQIESLDGGKSWVRRKTNISDVRESTPSLVFDPATGLVSNYYYQRGARQLKRRIAKASDIFGRPDAWPSPEILFTGCEKRDYDAGNVKVTALGGRHFAAIYTGSEADTSVLLVNAPSPCVDLLPDADGPDVFIGTSGLGHMTPAAASPFGAVQAGPDTSERPDRFKPDWPHTSGYQKTDTWVWRFSQTHLFGTGCASLGDFGILPYAAGFDGRNLPARMLKPTEKASPGRYAVTLDQNGSRVKCEIVALPHVALYRFSFEDPADVRLLLDLDWGVGTPGSGSCWSKYVLSSQCDFPDAGRAVGGRRVFNWNAYQAHFAAEFSAPVRSRVLVRSDDGVRGKVYELLFGDLPGGVLEMHIGLSFSSPGMAEKNLAKEAGTLGFEAVCERSEGLWRETLSRVELGTGGDPDVRKSFASALYRTMLQPNDIGDVGAVRYSTLSLWDTYRAAHPLYTILVPERVPDFVNSMLDQCDEQGYLPIWSLGGGENHCMIGHHAVPVIVDAFLKMRTGDTESAVDWNRAYGAVRQSLTVSHHAVGDGTWGLMKEDWPILDKYGYYPYDQMTGTHGLRRVRGESVSRLLECAYDDACAARMAAALGKTADAEFFARRSENWRNVFDKATGFMRGRDSKGNWRSPFNPWDLGIGPWANNDFCEGSAWQYTWHVMQNPQGLIEAFGGQGPFVKKLLELFEQPPYARKKGEAGDDATGLIGEYAHGNEPSHHVAYFFTLAGRQDLAAKYVRKIFDTQYSTASDGLCGNEDCGQMAAWYVFSAMGFYPFDPCGGEYVIGAPQVPKVTLNLANDKIFTMTARNLSRENKYVKSVMMNGKEITDWKIRHVDVMNGGELVFEMGKED